MRPLWFLLIPVFALLALWLGDAEWNLQQSRWTPVPEQLRIEVIPENIDTYLQQASIESYDEQGQLSYRIVSPLIEHWQHQDVSTLQTPEVEWYQERGSAWVEAQTGTLQHEHDELLLEGDVYVLQSRADADPMTLETDWMRMHLKDESAYAEQTLAQSAQWQTHASRLKARFDRGHYELEQVRSYYENSENSP